MSQISASQRLSGSAIKRPSLEMCDPYLPAWVLSLPGFSRIVDRVGVTEFRRRLIHMSPSLLPIGLPFIPHNDVWGPCLIGIVLFATIFGLYFASSFQHLFKRKTDEKWSHAMLGYVIPIVVPLLLLPGRAELGLMTLQIIALGDGSATLGGLLLGGQRLPWNSKKTFSGLFCFLLIGSLAATYSYWGEASPAVPVGTVYVICVAAALSAGIVESLPIRSIDNFRVGTTALLVGTLMSAWLA